MGFIISLLFLAMEIFVWVMIVEIVMSWLMAFNVLNASNSGVMKIYRLLTRFTAPVLNPIRRVIPAIGGIDISPIVVIIGVEVLRKVILQLVYF